MPKIDIVAATAGSTWSNSRAPLDGGTKNVT
jgi:hypothetical protein